MVAKELPEDSPFSFFHFPRGVLGLQTCDTTFGSYWVTGIYIQVTRSTQSHVSWPRNVLMSFCQDPLSQLCFYMCCTLGLLLNLPLWMLGRATWAFVIFISVQHVKTNNFLFRTSFFLWPFPEQNPIWTKDGSNSLWLHTSRHLWSPTHLCLGASCLWHQYPPAFMQWPLGLNLDH